MHTEIECNHLYMCLFELIYYIGRIRVEEVFGANCLKQNGEVNDTTSDTVL